VSDERGTPSGWGSEAKGWPIALPLVQVSRSPFCFLASLYPALVRERRPLAHPPSDQPAAASVGWLDQARLRQARVATYRLWIRPR